MKRISLLVLFFASVADFVLEHGRIDAMMMTSTFVLLVWTALYSWRRSRNAHGSSQNLPHAGTENPQQVR